MIYLCVGLSILAAGVISFAYACFSGEWRYLFITVGAYYLLRGS